MTLHPNHQRQIEDGIKASLTKAGIGKVYHDRTLATVPGGETIAEWLREGARETLSGGCIEVIGQTDTARDALMVLGRALHINGLGVRIASLPALVRATQNYEGERTVHLGSPLWGQSMPQRCFATSTDLSIRAIQKKIAGGVSRSSSGKSPDLIGQRCPQTFQSYMHPQPSPPSLRYLDTGVSFSACGGSQL